VEATPLRRNRDFALLWTGEVASEVGTRTASIAYPLIALALTDSPAWAGALLFARTIPWFLLVLPAGVLADRLDRRRIMLACDACACAAMVTVAVALALDRLTLVHLFGAVVVEGSAFIFLHVAYAGVLKQLVRPEHVPDAVAFTAARESAATLAGPPIGGVLYGISRALPFAVNGVSYLFSFVSLMLIRKPFQETREKPSGRIVSDVREGLAWLWRQTFLRTSLLLVGGSNFFTNAVVFTLIVRARQDGASAGLIGAMLATLAAGALLGTFAARWLRRRLSARTIIVGFFWIGAVVAVPLALVSEPIALGAIFAAMQFFGPVWNTVVDGYRISIVPDELQGRVASADNLMAFSALPLGPLVAGVLIERFGGDATLLALGAFMVVVAAAGTSARSLRVAIDVRGAMPE
jgi:MFS family permease